MLLASRFSLLASRFSLLASRFSLLALLIITACSQSTPVSDASKGLNDPVPLPSDNRYASIQNPANPFNGLGVLHNMAMDYTAERLLDTTITDVDAFLPNALLSFVIDLSPSDSVKEKDRATMRSFIDTLGKGRNDMTLSQRIDSYSMGSLQRSYVKEVFHIIERDSTLDETISDLSALESRILVTASGGREYDAPLCLVAAAKHSAFYWYHINRCFPYANVTYNSDGGIYDPPEDPDMKKDQSGKKKVSTVIEADLIGCLEAAWSGGIAGGVGGFLSGVMGAPFTAGVSVPVATSFGFFGGVLGGGVAGFAVSSVKEAYNQWGRNTGGGGGQSRGEGGWPPFGKAAAEFRAKFK